jgi:membrane glycosyltransferase
MLTILRNFVTTAARRGGTTLGGILSTLGVASDDASAIVAVLPIVAGVIFDTLVSLYLGKKGLK